jgi:hypothetical protein
LILSITTADRRSSLSYRFIVEKFDGNLKESSNEEYVVCKDFLTAGGFSHCLKENHFFDIDFTYNN